MNEMLRVVATVIGAAIAILLFVLLARQPVDERFITYRLKSSRAALAAGVVVLAAFFEYDLIVGNQVRYDLLAVLAAMLVVKVGMMVYYRVVG